jgi:Ca2+-transporting ATPase
MTVTHVYAGKEIRVEGVGYEPEGRFRSLADGGVDLGDERLNLLLVASALCNNSDIIFHDGMRKVRGDPTEGSLLVLAEKAGLSREGLGYERVGELSFDSERKMMSVVCSKGGGSYVFTKGAPEAVLGICTSEFGRGKLTKKRRDELLKLNEKYASSGLRVLGLAYKEHRETEEVEGDLTFLGLVGMIDPPREEAKEAIESCNRAGIKVVIVTGDHLLTAKAVGEQLGLIDDRSLVVVGAELDGMSDEELEDRVEEIAIFARVSAEHKIRIVKALKRRGHVVAMTGDGINDAPSLKAADIGVAMGITGTDVAKEASDMVLTDDNFASIVSAVEEGRGIYNNIKKTTHYLLSCNVSEVLVISIALFGLSQKILIPLQILWMNLVTDGLPAIALGMDPLPAGIMGRKPRVQKEPILDRRMLLSILLIGLTLTLAVLLPYYLSRLKGAVFTLIIFLQLVVALSIREEPIGKVKNRILGIAILGSIALQLAVVYTPLNEIFETSTLGPFELGMIALICLMVFGALEARKAFRGQEGGGDL